MVSLLKLILQLLNSVGWGHMSTEICSAFLSLGPPSSGTVTVRAVLSVGNEIVGIDVLGTATGAFELLAGGALGAAANFGAAFGIDRSLSSNSSGSPPACGRWQIAGSVTRLTDDTDVPKLSSTKTPRIELISVKTLISAFLAFNLCLLTSHSWSHVSN